MPELGSISHFVFAERTWDRLEQTVSQTISGIAVAHLFNRVLNNITKGYHLSSLAKSVDAIKRLFFRHWIPLGLEKMNAASSCKIQPNFQSEPGTYSPKSHSPGRESKLVPYPTPALPIEASNTVHDGLLRKH